MNNDDLFPSNPYPPYQRSSETSREAADRIAPFTGKMNRKVLEVFAGYGMRGATRDRVSVEGKIPIPTVCSRANKLLEIGALEETGDIRDTSSRFPAKVLRITQAGAAMLLQSGQS